MLKREEIYLKNDRGAYYPMCFADIDNNFRHFVILFLIIKVYLENLSDRSLIEEQLCI